jgi:hypothetical protein
VDLLDSGYGPAANSCEHGDESSGSGARELVNVQMCIKANVKNMRSFTTTTHPKPNTVLSCFRSFKDSTPLVAFFKIKSAVE